MLSEAEVAWIAGLLEGEGSFRVTSNGGLQVSCGMTDKDTIEKLRRLAGGYITKPHVTKGGKTLYPWCLSMREDVLQLCRLIYPWMGARRQSKIDELFAYARAYPKGRPRSDQAQHGSLSMYAGPKKCRCEPCREAGRAYRKKRKERNVQAEEA